MAVPTRTVCLLIPFAVVAWVQWTQSMQQERNYRLQVSAAPTLAQRDRLLSRHARARWLSNVEGSLNKDSVARSHAVDAPVQQDRAETSRQPAGQRAEMAAEHVYAAANSENKVKLAAKCPQNRRPYHVLLTATAQVALCVTFGSGEGMRDGQRPRLGIRTLSVHSRFERAREKSGIWTDARPSRRASRC